MGLRALLIQKGVKPRMLHFQHQPRLRALLIQKGVKLKQHHLKLTWCLRALLIQKGVKHCKDASANYRV